jgi:hypothetical protein
MIKYNWDDPTFVVHILESTRRHLDAADSYVEPNNREAEVYCPELNVSWPSQHAAARELGEDQSNIAKCQVGKRKYITYSGCFRGRNYYKLKLSFTWV